MWAYIVGALLGGKGGQAGTTAAAPTTYQHINLGSPFGANTTPTPVPAGALRAGTGRLYSQTGFIARGPVSGIAARQAATPMVRSYGAVSSQASIVRSTPMVSAPFSSTASPVSTVRPPAARRV